MADSLLQDAGPVVAAVWRGDWVESVHRAHAVLVDEDGRLLAALGDPEAVTYWRSSAKPFQALGLIEGGARERFGLTPGELAVACGSHAGEPMHVARVQSILAKVGLGEDALACGAHPPMHDPSAEALRSAGERPRPIHCNCSGKHAGMLAQAVAAGAPPDNYLDPEHPVQCAIAARVARVSGLEEAQLHIAVDGCGAPVFGLSLQGMARAFAQLAADSAELGEIRRAMLAHPEMVAGTDRFDTLLMRAAGGEIVCKGGAEAVHCLGLPGRKWGFAIKIDDGNARALPAVVLAALAALGLDCAAPELTPFRAPELRNHAGTRVGHIEAPAAPWADWRP